MCPDRLDYKTQYSLNIMYNTLLLAILVVKREFLIQPTLQQQYIYIHQIILIQINSTTHSNTHVGETHFQQGSMG